MPTLFNSRPPEPPSPAIRRRRPRRLSMLALAALMSTGAVPAARAAGPSQAATTGTRTTSFSIDAGPLELVLARFAAAAGVALSFDPEQISNRHSPGIKGSYSAEEGLRLLLEGTGLALEAKGDGAYTLRKLPAAPAAAEQAAAPEVAMLPVVRVSARADAPELADEGKAADGYRARSVSALGAMGRRDLLDTPFSISVVPQALVQNMQAQSPDDIYKLNASTRTTTPQASGWTPAVTIRGFASYDTAEDGLRRPYNHAAVIEDKERVEVLGGLSGFLYGAASPGGMVNYVSKRPTVERLSSVTIGNYGGSQYYLHGDFGGRIDAAGTVGYRLNVVGQDGDTAIKDQHIRRELVSGALEWQATGRLLLEFNAAYNRYRTDGASAYWFYDVPHGKAPDASKLWSQSWIGDEFQNGKLMGRMTFRLNDRVTLRAAYKRDFVDRPVQDHAMNYVGSEGEYEQLRLRSGRTKDRFDAASALIDIAFDTGSLAHKLTAGYTMYADKSWATPYNPNTGWQGPYPLTEPAYVAEPTFPVDTSSPFYAGRVANRNFIVGDSVRFNEQWSALLGVARSRILTQSFDAEGARTQLDYNRSRTSPSISVLFKPAPWMTTYASYNEGLEQGGTAPDTASNAGEVLQPMVSKQKELGIKANMGGMLLAGAVFEIEKAYEYTDTNNVYGQSGRQNHQGLEVSATGKPVDRLTLVAGATLLRARVNGGEFDGKQPLNVAELLVKIYSEYELADIPGLSLTGGLYRTGRQWGNDANTDRLPGYTTLDLGARFAARALGKPLTLRLAVNNVTNKSYWMNSYYVGAPRSVAFSAQLQF